MKLKGSFMTAAALGLGLSLGTGVFAFASESKKDTAIYSDAKMTKNVVQEEPNVYRTNSSGETYGSSANALYIEDFPDLMAVIGDNGKEGYVRTIDMIGEAPASPEEALKIQENSARRGNPPTIINVYDSDGKTVIDTYTMQNSK